MFYFKRNPFFLRQWYKKSLIWRIPNAKVEIFLTFDDGPTPELTPSILEILKLHDVKATFFCVGENVLRYPELFNQILNEGHNVGNHTFNHLNAWETDRDVYVKNVDKATKLIPSKLFRPPYGKITPKLIKRLKTNYSLFMWTVLSGDFDVDVNPEQCFKNATAKAKAGDILVFHDNVKAKKNVLEALPKTLTHFNNLGIKVKGLPS
jgi:peptidoglycan/xylan/chitin deacetylase (PgdA/CDA1 family)